MNKTLLIGSTNIVSNKVSKWIFSTIGIIYIVLGSIELYQSIISFQSVGWLILGIVFLLYGQIIYSATPLTPRVKINYTRLEFKNKVFGKTQYHGQIFKLLNLAPMKLSFSWAKVMQDFLTVQILKLL